MRNFWFCIGFLTFVQIIGCGKTTVEEDQPCPIGKTNCLDSVVFRCQDSTWVPIDDCANQGRMCLDGRCVCSSGERRCQTNVVQECSAGEWQSIQDCSVLSITCVAGVCIHEVNCVDGERSCDGSRALVCAGGDWKDSADCLQDDKSCVEGVCVCSRGATRCLQDTVQTCVGDDWQVSLDCQREDKSCVDGLCICAEGATRCEQETVQACVRGSWQRSSDCLLENKICAQGECQIVEPQDPGQPGLCGFSEVESSADGVAYRILIPQGQTGPFPVVVVNHGFLLPSEQYHQIAEHIASWCYITVLNEARSAANHTQYTDDIVGVVQHIKSDQRAELAGLVDRSNIVLLGHSVGGKASLWAGTLASDQFRTIIGLDPVDSCGPGMSCPSVTPELIGDLDVPTLLIGEQWSGNHSRFGQYCAPLDDNYQQYFESIKPDLPTLEITLIPAYHQSWLDDAEGCGIQCRLCAANPDADHELVKAFTKRYVMAWLELYCRNRVDRQTYLWGEQMEVDVALGVVDYRLK